MFNVEADGISQRLDRFRGNMRARRRGLACRRGRWSRLLGAGVLGLLAAWCGTSLAAATPPNIIFLLADDLGYGDLGVTNQNARAAQGLPSFATPNIDALAAAGTSFSSMYSGGPVCTPARATLLTGFHQGHAFNDRGNLAQDIRGGDLDETWGQVLQQAGYDTGMFGKWHLGGHTINTAEIRTPSALPTQKGFDVAYGSMHGAYRLARHWESDGAGGMTPVTVPVDPTIPGGTTRMYGDDLMTDRAIDFIRTSAASANPFAAYVAFTAPHEPVNQVPQDHPYVNMPWDETMRNYAGIIWRMDRHIGQIISAVSDPNGDGDSSDSVAGNTLIMFASDNGPAVPGTSAVPGSSYDWKFFDSNGIYSGIKTTMYEGGVRTPFFARWDGVIPAGSTNDAHVGSFADMMPTFAELAGQDVPLGVDGRSMASVLTGGPPSEAQEVSMWSFQYEVGPNNPGGWSVRVGDWKLIRRRPSTGLPNPSNLLYNLATDPSELVNRVFSRPDIAAALLTIGIAEGGERQPLGPALDNPAYVEDKNTYFTQYKTWAPQGGSVNFFAAANWAGGTQRATAADPEANNWNTGPADNWLATLANVGGGNQQVTLNANADVLAMEVRAATGAMTLQINPGTRLSARNGLRIAHGGVVRLRGGEINTIRDVDIRAGGRLIGEGTVNGQQSVLANIPELANLGFFEPRVANAGLITVSSATGSLVPATLSILGDFAQSNSGTLKFDLFNAPGASGFRFDRLTTADDMELDGTIEITFAEPLTVNLGDSFELLVAGGNLTGYFDYVFAPQLSGGKGWAMHYTQHGATLKVVEAPFSGGPLDFYARWKGAFGLNGNGDWDGDADSDGTDFLAWQRSGFEMPANVVISAYERWKASFGIGLGGDFDFDGDTDGIDFLAWQRGDAGATGAVAAAVPEPAALGLAAFAAVVATAARPGLKRRMVAVV